MKLVRKRVKGQEFLQLYFIGFFESLAIQDELEESADMSRVFSKQKENKFQKAIAKNNLHFRE